MHDSSNISSKGVLTCLQRACNFHRAFTEGEIKCMGGQLCCARLSSSCHPLSFCPSFLPFSPSLASLSLQEAYGGALYDAVLELLGSSQADPAHLLKHVHRLIGEDCHTGCLLSLLHAYLMHSNMGLLLHLPQ